MAAWASSDVHHQRVRAGRRRHSIHEHECSGIIQASQCSDSWVLPGEGLGSAEELDTPPLICFRPPPLGCVRDDADGTLRHVVHTWSGGLNKQQRVSCQSLVVSGCPEVMAALNIVGVSLREFAHSFLDVGRIRPTLVGTSWQCIRVEVDTKRYSGRLSTGSISEARPSHSHVLLAHHSTQA